MKSEKYHLYKDIDWAHIYMQLHFVALRCAARMPDVFDGISAEDLVTQVLSTFFEDSNALGWDPKVGSLDQFLLGVLRKKTIDRIRRQRRIAGSVDDPDFAQGVSLVQATSNDQEMHELRAELQKAATGDPGLEELLKALADVDGGHNINQQLAKELKTTTQDIVNRRKRLIRRRKRSQ